MGGPNSVKRGDAGGDMMEALGVKWDTAVQQTGMFGEQSLRQERKTTHCLLLIYITEDPISSTVRHQTDRQTGRPRSEPETGRPNDDKATETQSEGGVFFSECKC